MSAESPKLYILENATSPKDGLSDHTERKLENVEILEKEKDEALREAREAKVQLVKEKQGDFERRVAERITRKSSQDSESPVDPNGHWRFFLYKINTKRKGDRGGCPCRTCASAD